MKYKDTLIRQTTNPPASNYLNTVILSFQNNRMKL